MAALAHLSVSPALEQAGLIVEPASVSEQLDTRAFVVIPDRAEAETLFTLDHSRGVRDPEWKAFFVESLVEFLVWQSHPYGRLSESDLNWLMGLVADSPSPSTPTSWSSSPTSTACSPPTPAATPPSARGPPPSHFVDHVPFAAVGPMVVRGRAAARFAPGGSTRWQDGSTARSR